MKTVVFLSCLFVIGQQLYSQASPSSGCAPLNVSFTPPAGMTTYYWEFGENGSDGTSTDQNPTYQFTSDTGYFSVLFVVDYRGCKDSLLLDSLIYINAPIPPDRNEGTHLIIEQIIKTLD
jgi:PKD repeat protein